MSQFRDTSGPTGGAGSPSSTDIAKDEARNVGQTAAQAGSQVAGTAGDQAKQVTQETKRQAQDLISQGRAQAGEQVRNGQQQAASSLSALAGELRSMADHDDQSSGGPAHDLVRQATGKVDDLAEWLQSREPGDLLEEARSFARRRPGTFLLGAALVGVVAGRLTTGVVAAHQDGSSDGSPQALGTGADANVYGAPAVYGQDTAYGQDAAYGAPAVYGQERAYPQDTAYGQGLYAPTETIDGAEGSPALTPYSEAPVDQTAPQSNVPPMPYGAPPPATESNWADPQRTRDDGTSQ